MKKNNEFRFLFLLLLGGMIFSYWQKVPNIIYEYIGIQAQAESEDSIIYDGVEMKVPTYGWLEKMNIDNRLDSVSENKYGYLTHISEALEKNEEQDYQNELASKKEQDEQEVKKLNTEVKEQETTKEKEEKEERVFCHVEDDYFDDACFIGDSRTVSIYMYSGWKADFYCSSGMTLKGVFGPPSRIFHDGNWKENIGEALQREHYKKVYIILGINDMGIGNSDTFIGQYEEVVSKIREWQPDAVIYVNGILKVSAERNAQGGSINNKDISARNERIKALANGYDIVYLDPNEVLCDENGNLRAEWTFDGVHLYAKDLYHWTDYIKDHAFMKKPYQVHKLGNN